MAQQQRQWPQAEQYYQQALQIYIQYDNSYEQAKTYHNLGVVAYEQLLWSSARDYFLTALMMFVTLNDTYYRDIALYNLARLWKASGDTDLLAAIASIFGTTIVETEAKFHKALREK